MSRGQCKRRQQRRVKDSGSGQHGPLEVGFGAVGCVAMVYADVVLDGDDMMALPSADAEY